MEFDKEFLGKLFEQAMGSPRLCHNYDLRTSPDDTNQRMLNILLPGTEVPVHRHYRNCNLLVWKVGRGYL